MYVYIYIFVYIYIYSMHNIYTYIIIRPGRVCCPGKFVFDCKGPMFFEIRDVVYLPRWRTRFVSKTRNPKLQTLNPKP